MSRRPQARFQLQQAITDRGMLKRDAARKMGMMASALSYILTGKRVPTIRQAAAIKDMFHVPMRPWLPIPLPRPRRPKA